jgi:hypothetical protein
MLTFKSLATKLWQFLSLSPTKALQKEMFRGVELKTSPFLPSMAIGRHLCRYQVASVLGLEW